MFTIVFPEINDLLLLLIFHFLFYQMEEKLSAPFMHFDFFIFSCAYLSRAIFRRGAFLLLKYFKHISQSAKVFLF